MNQRGLAYDFPGLDVLRLLHKEVCRATERVVRILHLSGSGIFRRVHQILRSVISVKVAVHGMEWQVTPGSLAIRRTVAALIRWARLALSVAFTGLTHRTVMVHSRSVAP